MKRNTNVRLKGKLLNPEAQLKLLNVTIIKQYKINFEKVKCGDSNTITDGGKNNIPTKNHGNFFTPGCL